ncbi:hypothetical protein BDN70DRAFT_908077 [Pholiota conissans]|uniref:Aminoglycoside phosphotransferase domain-containing protein n=1 Tax=Pholiota conissans TaxID=109636 RepID=A0A9P5YVZ0_9AGAR|nr:hypothetical protein BDN70DRAFT_908077 [Pholiota conissans]
MINGTNFNCAEEVAATRYVEANTAIPVPHILDCVSLHRPGLPLMGLVVMKVASGHPLGQKGEHLDKMSQRQKDVFVQTLRGWFEQLQSLLPPDEHIISGSQKGGLYSFRIRDVLDGPLGPYPTQHVFHAQDFCTPWPIELEKAEVAKALEHRSRTNYKICLTHGDLIPLIDWETASWMPEYWELTRALFLRLSYTGWVEPFKRIFPGYDSEVIVESAIWRHWEAD